MGTAAIPPVAAIVKAPPITVRPPPRIPVPLPIALKFSKFQSEFMKSPFPPKKSPEIVKISAL